MKKCSYFFSVLLFSFYFLVATPGTAIAQQGNAGTEQGATTAGDDDDDEDSGKWGLAGLLGLLGLIGLKRRDDDDDRRRGPRTTT